LSVVIEQLVGALADTIGALDAVGELREAAGQHNRTADQRARIAQRVSDQFLNVR
jgi:hypothetical protein